MRTIVWFTCLTVLLTTGSAISFAQNKATKPKGKTLKDGITTFNDPPLNGSKSVGKKGVVTTVTVELLTTRDRANQRIHDWVDVLGKQDVIVTTRNGAPDDKLGVFESREGGALRKVKIVASLDEKSRMVLPDQVFALDDLTRISNWIKDLRQFGAQGNPDGQKAWGLTQDQLDALLEILRKPVTNEIKEKSVSQAVSQIELPVRYQLTYSAAATKRLKERGEQSIVRQELSGVSQGTALAVLLSEQGLGFRPRRQPDGRIELTIETVGESKELWPIGWPRQVDLPQLAPSLFKIQQMEIAEEQPLDELLDAVAEKIKLPVLYDYAGLAAKDIDLSQVKVLYPYKKTSWITAIREFTYKGRTRAEVLIDEAGRPFLWVVPVGAPARESKG